MTRAPKGDGYLPEQKIHVNIKKRTHRNFKKYYTGQRSFRISSVLRNAFG